MELARNSRANHERDPRGTMAAANVPLQKHTLLLLCAVHCHSRCSKKKERARGTRGDHVHDLSRRVLFCRPSRPCILLRRLIPDERRQTTHRPRHQLFSSRSSLSHYTVRTSSASCSIRTINDRKKAYRSNDRVFERNHGLTVRRCFKPGNANTSGDHTVKNSKEQHEGL